MPVAGWLRKNNKKLKVYEGEKDQAIEWTMVQKHNGTKAQGDINFVNQKICLEKN